MGQACTTSNDSMTNLNTKEIEITETLAISSAEEIKHFNSNGSLKNQSQNELEMELESIHHLQDESFFGGTLACSNTQHDYFYCSSNGNQRQLCVIRSKSLDRERQPLSPSSSSWSLPQFQATASLVLQSPPSPGELSTTSRPHHSIYSFLLCTNNSNSNSGGVVQAAEASEAAQKQLEKFSYFKNYFVNDVPERINRLNDSLKRIKSLNRRKIIQIPTNWFGRIGNSQFSSNRSNISGKNDQ
jgi:hypothetical protein